MELGFWEMCSRSFLLFFVSFSVRRQICWPSKRRQDRPRRLNTNNAAGILSRLTVKAFFLLERNGSRCEIGALQRRPPSNKSRKRAFQPTRTNCCLLKLSDRDGCVWEKKKRPAACSGEENGKRKKRAGGRGKEGRERVKRDGKQMSA